MSTEVALGAQLLIERHLAAFLYLLPPLVLALWLHARTAHAGMFTKSAVHAVGTFIHELLHLSVGILTGARPLRMSILPCRIACGYQLGYVSFSNLRWFNSLFVGLAPLLGLVAAVGYAVWRTQGQGSGWQFRLDDAVAWLLIAQLFLSSWPSRTDFVIALRSWPILAAAAGVVWFRFL